METVSRNRTEKETNKIIMCGITGFIGRSKDTNLSYELLTKLFEKSDTRGTDAAGLWATEAGFNGSVIYHKEPIRSSKFVKNKFWNDVSNFDIDLIIAHARGASKGVGEPFFNENNHPFTSTNKAIGLAHNGRIENDEYYELKKIYEVLTTCDSEILLRIFESGARENNLNVEKELDAIKNIFGLVKRGHMAVAAGVRKDSGKRSLFLFRNEHRPLWISDLRKELGQIFFFSEPNIWEEACEGYENKLISMCYKLIEIKPREIWQIDSIDGELNIDRYEAKIDGQECSYEDAYFTIPQEAPCFNVITKLDNNDQIIRDELISIWEEFDIKSLENCVSKITEKSKSIESELKYAISKGSIKKEGFDKALAIINNADDAITSLLLAIYEL